MNSTQGSTATWRGNLIKYSFRFAVLLLKLDVESRKSDVTRCSPAILFSENGGTFKWGFNSIILQDDRALVGSKAPLNLNRIVTPIIYERKRDNKKSTLCLHDTPSLTMWFMGPADRETTDGQRRSFLAVGEKCSDFGIVSSEWDLTVVLFFCRQNGEEDFDREKSHLAVKEVERIREILLRGCHLGAHFLFCFYFVNISYLFLNNFMKRWKSEILVGLGKHFSDGSKPLNSCESRYLFQITREQFELS